MNVRQRKILVLVATALFGGGPLAATETNPSPVVLRLTRRWITRLSSGKPARKESSASAATCRRGPNRSRYNSAATGCLPNSRRKTARFTRN